MISREATQPAVETYHAHDTTNPRADTIGQLAASRVVEIAGHSVISVTAADLMEQVAWSSRTDSSRQSQWRVWLAFCIPDNRPSLPVTECHVLTFFGWLKSERRAERRRITAALVPQYLSAVRQMHLLYVGSEFPPFPFADLVLRSYKKWETDLFPSKTVLVGASAEVIQQVLAPRYDNR